MRIERPKKKEWDEEERTILEVEVSSFITVGRKQMELCEIRLSGENTADCEGKNNNMTKQSGTTGIFNRIPSIMLSLMTTTWWGGIAKRILNTMQLVNNRN